MSTQRINGRIAARGTAAGVQRSPARRWPRRPSRSTAPGPRSPTRSTRSGSASTTSCNRRSRSTTSRIGSGGGHPADPAADGVLRRDRRAHDAGPAAGCARQDPALSHGSRRRRPRLQHPRRQAGAEVHGPGARRHHPRQDHEVERPGDRQAERRRHAARHRHRRRAPLGRLGHDLHLGRLPVEGLAGISEDGRRRRRR